MNLDYFLDAHLGQMVLLPGGQELGPVSIEIIEDDGHMALATLQIWQNNTEFEATLLFDLPRAQLLTSTTDPEAYWKIIKIKEKDHEPNTPRTEECLLG